MRSFHIEWLMHRTCSKPTKTATHTSTGSSFRSQHQLLQSKGTLQAVRCVGAGRHRRRERGGDA